MTTPVTESKTLPLVQCQPWCVDQDGHPECIYLEDRWCGTESLEVALSLEPEVPAGEGTAPDGFSVSALRVPGEPIKFQLDHLAGGCIDLTAGEAAELVEAFQLLLGRIGE